MIHANNFNREQRSTTLGDFYSSFFVPCNPIFLLFYAFFRSVERRFSFFGLFCRRFAEFAWNYLSAISKNFSLVCVCVVSLFFPICRWHAHASPHYTSCSPLISWVRNTDGCFGFHCNINNSWAYIPPISMADFPFVSNWAYDIWSNCTCLPINRNGHARAVY